MNKHFVDIIKRIKEIKGLHTDAQVAKALEITKNNLYASKTRDNLPIKHLHSFCSRENIRLDYLLTGTLPIYDQIGQTIAEPPGEYNIGHLRRVTDHPQIRIADILQKVTYILESESPHKAAIASLIDICHGMVAMEKRIRELEDRLKPPAGKLPPAAHG